METYNYNQFKFNDRNRAISKKNVSDLKKSILEVGFVKQRAILVNKENLIIDGHHRFLALKELKLPIYYEIENELSKREMILLNSSQKSWSLEDFIRFYAKDNILFYKEVLRVNEIYKFTISNCLIICLDSSGTSGTSSKSIRKGENLSIYDKIDELSQLILFFETQISFSSKSHYVRALKNVHSKLNSKQLEKLKDGMSSMREQTSYLNYLITFENIINRKMRNDNKVN